MVFIAFISNLPNNARFLDQRLQLPNEDMVCCYPPLFHCIGLVKGSFPAYIYGATIVFLSNHSNADLVLDSIEKEQCFTLLAIPTMFFPEPEANETKKYVLRHLRKGMVARSPVVIALMQKLKTHAGIKAWSLRTE